MQENVALMTGITGFVGSRLAQHLMAEGWHLHGIIRPGSSLASVEALLPQLTCHIHDGSTEGMEAIVQRVKPTVVFHLASLFLAQHQVSDVKGLIDSNLLFATQLADAMARQGVRYLVNTGTFWQHHENRTDEPVNLYAATKQAFEAILAYYVSVDALQVITLKLSDTYGPQDPRKKLLHLLMNLASDGTPLAMSPGEQEIDLVHIDDVVRAFSMAATRLLSGQGVGYACYAVSSGQPVPLRGLVNIFEEAAGRALPIRWGERPYRPREVMQTWRGGQPLPGWQPAIGMAEGFSALLASARTTHP